MLGVIDAKDHTEQYFLVMANLACQLTRLLFAQLELVRVLLSQQSYMNVIFETSF